MNALLVKVLTTIVALAEEHPEIAKALAEKALHFLHLGSAPPAGATGSIGMRNQLAAQAGMQSGIAAAVASAIASADAAVAKREAARLAAEIQHDIDHGVHTADTPIPFTLPSAPQSLEEAKAVEAAGGSPSSLTWPPRPNPEAP